MMGLHPNYVKENYMDELEIVKKHLNNRRFYAVGEIGIDLFWDKKYLKQQQDAFNYQILLAKEKDLPIVIHCRDAFNEIFEVLESHRDEKLNGIFHCFTGTHDQALRAIDLNFKLGIGGVVTFKNGKIDKFLKQMPIEQIVLETDSPYLSPTPYRGKRNESSYLEIILRKVAECYELPIEEVSKIIYDNSKAIFKDEK
jgi:TatD DNase family protein